MDLRNFGATDLTLRLYFEDPIPEPPMNEAVTSFAINLPAGSDWIHLFPISAADLTVLTRDAAALLSNTTVMRLFNGADADFPDEPIAGLLRVDNITAVAVAQVREPASLALSLAGLGVLGVGGVSGRRASNTRAAGVPSAGGGCTIHYGNAEAIPLR